MNVHELNCHDYILFLIVTLFINIYIGIFKYRKKATAKNEFSDNT